MFLCHELGIATGIDLERLLDAARLAERIVGRRLEGKLMHAGIASMCPASRRGCHRDGIRQSTRAPPAG
ncbi:MAG: hypothetical protein U1E90_00190 [Burkholderiaceae bacterium]